MSHTPREEGRSLSNETEDPVEGCYGLRIGGLSGALRYLSAVDPRLPLLKVERAEPADLEPSDIVLTADRAVLALSGASGRSDVDRRTMTATLGLSDTHSDEEILHPFLAGTAAVTNWWLGRDAFHAGGFQLGTGTGARAWGVLGDKGQGKSTTLGFAGVNGLKIVTDDLLVVDAGHVHAGPAFVDLRGDAAVGLGVGRDLGVVGARHRARLDVSGSEPSLPLAGWITLAWGDEPALVPVPLEERLGVLLANRAVWRPPADPTSYLTYLAMPMFELKRPRSWSDLPRVLDLLNALD